MKAKRIISLLLVLCMALSVVALAGCSGEKKKSTADRTNEGVGASADDAFFDSVPEEAKGSTVYFATWIDHYQNYSADVFAAFENRTGIKVDLTKISQGDYPTKLSGLIASDQSPDVVVDIQFPAVIDLLMPLEEAGVDATDPFWDQEISKIGKVGKYHYLVNGANSLWRMGPPYVIYNKTNMTDYGITTPRDYFDQGNWTLETFFKCAEQCKKLIPNTTRGAVIDARLFITTYGDPIFTYDSETSTFQNNSTSVKSLDAWKILLEKREQGLVNVYDERGDFEKGAAHMYLGGGYSLRSDGWFTSTMDTTDLDYVCLPKAKSIDLPYPSGAQWRAYGVCKGSKNAVAAGYFLRYYLNGDHYNWDTAFKSADARALYEQSIKDGWDYNRIDYTNTIMLVTGTSVNDILKDALNSSAAQISVDLQKTSSTVSHICEEANKKLANAVNNQ